MIKKAPSPVQMLFMAAFAASCVGLLLYLWLSFGGAVPLRPDSYRFEVAFPEATQLADQSSVRISGVPVGKVVGMEVGRANTTRATIELKAKYAPIPVNTRAMLRQKSLLGETFVDLSPGDRSGEKLADGEALPRGAVHPTVELDEIFRSFDAATQKGFRTWMQTQAGAVEGRGADINAAFGVLPEFADSSERILRQLNAQSRATSKLFANTGEVFDAISERDGQLQGLITNTNRVFNVTNTRNRELAQIFRELPRFERESRTTLPVLTRFSRRADPVVRQLQPAASAFEPVFNDVQRLSPEFKGFFARLGPLVTAAERGVPAFEQVMRDIPPVLKDFQPFLRNLNPMIGLIDANKREVTSLLGNLTGATNAKNLDLPGGRNVNYLRAAQVLGPQALSYLARPLGSTRTNAYNAPGGLSKIAGGLPVLDTSGCANGDVDQPTSSDPETLTPLVKLYAFRTEGRRVARPGCTAQGNYPGFDTVFPQLKAEP
jgi:virulence factor Mce-like protein